MSDVKNLKTVSFLLTWCYLGALSRAFIFLQSVLLMYLSKFTLILKGFFV